MGRKRKFHIEPWLTANDGNEPEDFICISKALLKSPKFQRLTSGARMVYLSMCMEAVGKPEFTFPAATMAEYNMPRKSCQRHIQELIEAGFVRKREHDKGIFHPNEYEFLPIHETEAGGE